MIGQHRKFVNDIMKKVINIVGIFVVVGACQASAHIGYGGRNFGTFAGGSVIETRPDISITNVSSNFGWAAATDANFGDSHRTRAFRFTMASAGTVRLTVEGGPGLLPGVSLYRGLAHLAPDAASHDGALASQTYLLALPGPTKSGAFNALGNWAIGNDPVYNIANNPASGVAISASLRFFGYIGNMADGTTSNYGNALGINGDGVADGFVTGTFHLAAGDYSFFVGGANLSGEGPAPYTNFGATVSLAVIPESSSCLLFGLAGLGLMGRRHRIPSSFA